MPMTPPVDPISRRNIEPIIVPACMSSRNSRVRTGAPRSKGAAGRLAGRAVGALATAVSYGTGPERMIQTGIGPTPVQRQKVRDRAADVPAEKKIRVSLNILPRWARRSRSLDVLLPVLYLRGVSTGDLGEALTALLGVDAPNLSPGVISRLTAGWQEDYDRWQHRDLSALQPDIHALTPSPSFPSAVARVQSGQRPFEAAREAKT